MTQIEVLPKKIVVVGPSQVLENIDTLYELADLIERAIRNDALPTINEGGIIRPEFNEELSELIEINSFAFSLFSISYFLNPVFSHISYL